VARSGRPWKHGQVPRPRATADPRRAPRSRRRQPSGQPRPACTGGRTRRWRRLMSRNAGRRSWSSATTRKGCRRDVSFLPGMKSSMPACAVPSGRTGWVLLS